MGTCASVKANQVHPLQEGHTVHQGTVEDGEGDLYKLKTEGVSMKTGDVQRALICSEAVYLSDLPKIEEFFSQARDLHNFVRVRVSRGSPWYLLAETRDKEEVFVAFKGTTNFKDVMADLSCWQEGAAHNTGVGGKYHSGFMHLAFRVPANRILEEYSNSRIVVCGHSLGGAVAHIVALNMLMYLQYHGRSVDTVKSIAFGAPYFGNNRAQQFAEKHNLSPRLLTIVNEEDPVTYILRLAETIQCLGQTVLNECETTVESILASLSNSGILGSGANLVKSAFSGIPAKLSKCRGMLKDWGDSARDLNSMYVPVGWYLYFGCSTTKAGGGGHWHRSLLTHPGAIQYVAPDNRLWEEEDFQCHGVSNYRRNFFEIEKRTTYREEDENTPSGSVIVTEWLPDELGPAPEKSFLQKGKDYFAGIFGFGASTG